MSDGEADEYIVTRKRVGGGYKDVVVKKPVVRKRKKKKRLSAIIPSETESESEKQDVEVTEKTIIETEIDTEIHLPIPREELQSRNSCDGKIKYDEHPILRYIQDNIIGHDIVIDGPFGQKKVVYCDYTASGRSVTFIEDYIRNYVLPLYANTHSETGRNARQTQKFREEARSIIKRCINAGKDDVVIFTGSGSTSGIHKLAWSLKINQPRVADETVVITGPFEHHSNVLIWKELGTTLVRLKENDQGTVDLDMLERELKFWKEKKRLLLVSISAASNVTGIITDTEQVARIAHQYGAFVAFDYAGGGPYLKIDMNSSKQSYKDAVFISPHKFVGGPGSPGILVAKRWMFKNQIPDRVGGGTVTYVTRDTHAYSSNIEGREEGGTPAIIESIRTGLAFLLKDAVTEHVIMARDEDLCCRAFAVWEQNPNLIILGNHNAERVTIFSFIVRHAETEKFIHFNFVSTLLNDLFGIQSRGGCACAGPYVHDLLGISETMAKRLKWFVDESKGKTLNTASNPIGIMRYYLRAEPTDFALHIAPSPSDFIHGHINTKMKLLHEYKPHDWYFHFRPGFVRVNLPYFYDDETVDYIIKAVDMVATHGWKLLPKYTFESFTGNFKHKGKGTSSRPEEEVLFSLQDIDCKNYGKFHVNREPPQSYGHVTLKSMMADAERILREALDDIEQHAKRPSTATRDLHEIVPKDRQKLRWFMTPQEVVHYVTGSKRIMQFKPIMTPRVDFREKEWNSAPDTYGRPFQFAEGNNVRAIDDMTITNQKSYLKRKMSTKIGKLPLIDTKNAGESINAMDCSDDEVHDTQEGSITVRESKQKVKPKRLLNYESDSELYIHNFKTSRGRKVNRKQKQAAKIASRNNERNVDNKNNKADLNSEGETEDLINTWPKQKGILNLTNSKPNNLQRKRGSSVPRSETRGVMFPDIY